MARRVYTQSAINKRIGRDGEAGTAVEQREGGAYYVVRFDDTLAFFDATELEVVP